MSIESTTLESTFDRTTQQDPDVNHYACHCTNYTIAACGEDVANEEWVHPGVDLEHDCALCVWAIRDELDPRCDYCWVCEWTDD